MAESLVYYSSEGNLLIDAALKGPGRVNMNEVSVYRVKEGKLVSEQFFFSPE